MRHKTEIIGTATKLVCGVGTNDVLTTVIAKKKGRGQTLPWYRKWCSMLKRCYCEKYQKKNPTYLGCKVCDSWLLASNFKKWFDAKYIEGYYLDKDLLFPGNTVYGPETCVFVPVSVNNLLLSRGRARGPYPIGVYKGKGEETFTGQISIYGKQTKRRGFETAEQAHWWYASAKINHVREVCDQLDKRLDKGLSDAIESHLWKNFSHVFGTEETYEDRPWNV